MKSFSWSFSALVDVAVAVQEAYRVPALLESKIDVSDVSDVSRLIKSKCPGQEFDEDFQPAKVANFLTLIHIPRTGGTSIEDCTEEEDSSDRWGVKASQITGMNSSNMGCYRQHVPPSLIDSDYYSGKNTFCAVRDPFTRLISQYGFVYGFFGRSGTKEDMNTYLKESLEKVLLKAEDQDCHFLPQAAYVYGWNKTSGLVDRSMKSCKTVIKFEPSLGEAFNGLMSDHGYPYRLHMDRANGGTKSNEKVHFEKTDLSGDVVRLAEQVFHEDFELLGYERMSQAK